MWTTSFMPGRPWESWQGDLSVTKHRKLLKVIKMNENHAAALLRAAFPLSPCLAQCGCDPTASRCFLAQTAPLTPVGPGGCWELLLVKVTVCRIRVAHGDSSVLLLQCGRTEKKTKQKKAYLMKQLKQWGFTEPVLHRPCSLLSLLLLAVQILSKLSCSSVRELWKHLATTSSVHYFSWKNHGR